MLSPEGREIDMTASNDIQITLFSVQVNEGVMYKCTFYTIYYKLTIYSQKVNTKSVFQDFLSYVKAKGRSAEHKILYIYIHIMRMQYHTDARNSGRKEKTLFSRRGPVSCRLTIHMCSCDTFCCKM